MTPPNPHGASGRHRLWLGIELLVLVLLCGAGLFGWSRFRGGLKEEALPDDVTDDPRLTIASPYRNVLPDVKYVGDAACADCHADIAQAYRHHPMGRSTAPVARIVDREDFALATHNPFAQFGFEFLAERRGDRVLHAVVRKGNDGREVLREEHEVAYAVGSGARGRAYLVEVEGFLFQSPINWYSQKKRWDLAPNQAGHSQDLFAIITPQCVFCHANHADPIDTTLNRYHTPVFGSDAAIGCERCHGPGELHVRRQTQPDPGHDADDTVVNPRRLTPPLAEAVCQQCHLQGEVRIERHGRRTFDYRPGLPLERFWSVFVRAGETIDRQAVGQVEQMHDSGCFRGSSGAMTCTSCHDPHRLPEPGERVAYYRRRCLECHQQTGCPVSAAERQAKNGNDCVGCHMPRVRPTDTPHTALTDHRIARRPGQPARAKATRRPPLVPRLDLASFFPSEAAPGDPKLFRDLGVAMVEARVPPPDRPYVQAASLPLLEAALARAPHDLRARLARNQALWTAGRRAEAFMGYELVLKDSPEHELALRDAAELAEVGDLTDAALKYWQRAIAVNPRAADYHASLARVQAGLRQWSSAVTECRAALALNPTHLPGRRLLVQALLESGDRAAARAELKTLLVLDPSQKAAFERWLTESQQ